MRRALLPLRLLLAVVEGAMHVAGRCADAVEEAWHTVAEEWRDADTLPDCPSCHGMIRPERRGGGRIGCDNCGVVFRVGG